MTSAASQLNLLVAFSQDQHSLLEPLLADILDRQRFTLLEKILSRSDHTRLHYTSQAALLCSLFKVDSRNGVPYAALSWLADTGTVADKGLLRIDPVHLHPDMEHVLLFDSREFILHVDETAELLTSLNAFLAEYGWWIEAPDAVRWYLHGLEDNATSYTCLDEVHGNNILPHYPRGKLQQRWQQVLTEVQMLLHAHPVNQRREQQGQYTINGVWPWGKGEIVQHGKPGVTACYGDSVILKGLSLLTDCHYEDRSATVDLSGNSIVCLPAPAGLTAEALQACLQQLEQEWLPAIEEQLHTGELVRARIYIGHQSCYTITARSTRRWWRRKRPLLQLLKN